MKTPSIMGSDIDISACTERSFFMVKKYKEILRYHSNGFSQRQIASLTGVSRGTVIKVIDAFKCANISWEEVRSFTDTELEERLFKKDKEPSIYLEPDYEALSRELNRKGVTKKLLWEEYVQQCDVVGKLPYKYTQFCVNFNKFLEIHKATMHFEHIPGEKVEVDWAGQTIPIQDAYTGETQAAYLFVGALPYSQYVYAEVFPDMTEESWIVAHVHMFEFYQGTPPILVCDNLKTGVIRHPRNSEIILNDAYREMADYYDIAVLPAAVGTPKGKPSAEGSVGKLTMDILARLRNETFYSVQEAHQKVKKLLKDFNDRSFQKRDGSRISVFLLEELPKLRKLPKIPYEYGYWKQATVQYNYHVSIEKMYYSVPYMYIHQKALVRVTDNTVEIYIDHQRICSHLRLKGRSGQYSTNPDHMPPNHKAASEWNGQRFINWAGKIGPNTETVVKRLLESYKVEQQAYNGCRSILKLADSNTPKKLEAACAKALSLIHSPRYRNIKLIIGHIQDEDENEIHDDSSGAILRGSTYYGGNTNE